MKNHLKRLNPSIVLGLFLLLNALSIAPAHAQDNTDYTDWDIEKFNANIQINKDSTIDVSEQIEVNFSGEHHGIYRDIPVRYTDDKGNKSEIPIQVESVTNPATGGNWQYSVNNYGDYIEIKIGDPNAMLTGTQDYDITYKAQEALGNYSDHDELYWNVTGTQWGVPIKQASATVTLPQSVDKSKLQVTCYTGAQGSTDQNCTSSAGDGSFQFATTSADGEAALQAEEGLTIVAGYPKGIIQPSPPSAAQIWASAPWYEKIYLFLVENWGLLIPVAVGILMGWLWYTKGRDPRTGKTAIMPIYTAPDNLRPTEIGTIVDESVDIRDITSAIIDLAVRGYIKIVETKSKALFFNVTTYTFNLLKPDYANDKNIQSFEKKILDAVFGGSTTRNLNDLNNTFYKNIPGIKKDVYDTLVTKGYFPTNPENVRNTYMGIGGFILFGMFFLIAPLLSVLSWSLIVGIGLSGLIIMIVGRFMSAKTLKGAECRWQILGLEEFIKTAEADRLKFQEKENIFEKLLPYAMALNIADKWTKAFDGIYRTPPSWYSSNDPYFMTNFSTIYFLSSLNSFSGNMQQSFVSSPRSSGSGFGGGGFSGGGGGGGGGGAW
jgi:uncharacterized membrane protein